MTVLYSFAHAAGLTALLAVASSAVEETPEYPTVVVALLAFFGILDRLTRNAWHNRQLVQVLIDKLFEMRDRGDNRSKALAQNMLRHIEDQLAKASREKRHIFAKLLKRELIKRGEEKTTTRQRFGETVREAGRYLPIVGRLL